MARKKLDLTDENLSPVKAILWLAWPLFLEQILTTLVSSADTAMVGRLGEAATAAVSISNSFVFLINGIVIAMGVGLTAYIARNVGAKKYEEAKAYIRHAFLLLMMVGLPMALITMALYRAIPAWMGAEAEVMPGASVYLLITSGFRIFNMAIMVLGAVFRGRGDTKTPLYVNIGVNIINVVGNYLLINPNHTIPLGKLSIPMIGAGLGVTGAALSTGFSWMVGGVILSVLLFTKDDPTRISLKESFLPDKPLIKRVVSLSVPAMLERICMSGSGIVVTKCIASLGTTVFAANAVYVQAESISFMPGFAFATAATTLVGQALGAKKSKMAEKYTWYTIGIGAGVMAAAGVLLYAFAQPLVSIFTQEAGVIPIAARCLRIVAFVQPIQVCAWIFAGALRGAGDTRWPFYITATTNWCIRTLGAFLCIRVFGMGLPEAVVCMCLDNTVRCVATLIRFKGGKWKNAIRDRKDEQAETGKKDQAILLDRRVNMKKRPVILDTDIGGDIDDTWALGLLLESPELDLKMVITECGSPESKARILAKFLQEAGRSDVIVALGTECEYCPDRQAPWVEGYALGEYPGVVCRDGVDAMIRFIRAQDEPVTIIAIGPVTTLSDAVRKAPDIAEKCHLIGMHGCVRRVFPGFERVVPENNVTVDVPGWKNVFSQPWKSVEITPLDTCGLVQIQGEYWQQMLAGRDRKILDLILDNYRIWLGEDAARMERESSILYDAVAVYMAISHEYLKMETLDIFVDDDGLMTEDGPGEKFTLNCAMDWNDLDAFYRFLVDRLAGK